MNKIEAQKALRELPDWEDRAEAIIDALPAGVSMTLDEFLTHTVACGGNWGGMLLSGIRKLWPEVWEAIPDDMGIFPMQGIMYTMILCGVEIPE